MKMTPQNEQFDPVEGWQKVKEQFETIVAQKQLVHGKSSSIKNGHNKIFRFLRVAAIFIVAVLVSYFTVQITQNIDRTENQKGMLQEITTANGQRTRLTLAEGTHILLDAGSKMKLPKVFENNKREVYLEGQAYFEVAHNPEKPFVIHLNGTKVRVLGTKFSISAYPEDHSVEVVVKEGRVEFTTDNNKEPKSTLVTANELAKYNKDNNKLIKREVDDLNLYLGWIDYNMNFNNTQMSEVALDLERRYAVGVTFKDEKIKSMKLTAHLKSKEIENVLDVIAMSLKINYELSDDAVTFY